jgi:hypothetical protein
VKVLRLGAVVAKQTQLVGEGGIAGGDQATVTERSEVLTRKKREASRNTERPGRPAPIGRTDRLAGILDYRNAVLGRRGENRVHVGDQAVQVDGNDGPRLRGNGGADRARIDVEGDGVDVDQSRRRAKARNTAGGGKE